MEKKLLNRTEAATYLGVNRRTLRNWEEKNYGPKPTRVPSGQPYYSRDALDAFVANFHSSEEVTSSSA